MLVRRTQAIGTSSCLSYRGKKRFRWADYLRWKRLYSLSLKLFQVFLKPISRSSQLHVTFCRYRRAHFKTWTDGNFRFSSKPLILLTLMFELPLAKNLFKDMCVSSDGCTVTIINLCGLLVAFVINLSNRQLLS